MPNHHSIQHNLLMTTTFTLLSTFNSLAPLRSVASEDLELGFAEVVVDLLIVKRAHLHNIDTIHSLPLHEQNSRAICTVVVCDVLATASLSLEGFEGAGKDLVLVGGDHEVVGVCCAWGW
jgi:hypothetical protein